MKKPARSSIAILAVFLIVFCSGFTTPGRIFRSKKAKKAQKTEVKEQKQNNEVSLTGFNPLDIPEIAPAPVIEQNSYSEEAQSFDLANQIPTARDPRFEYRESSHRVPFIPASENTPPPPAISIPVVDNREPMHYDLNEWEEDRFFSSNLYTDTTFYTTNISGKKDIAPNREGEFYEENYRYELFSSGKKGDTMTLLVDGTFTNDDSNYNHHFMFNQFTFDVANQRSRLVLGHAFPEMSELSITQNILGIYGSHKFDETAVSAFGGYYETEKEDLDNPRYVGGFRVEHNKDDAIK